MASFTLSLALLLALQGGDLPTAPQSVDGRVVKPGDHKMDPIASMWVTLHRVGSDAQGPIDSVRTDAKGHYAFHYHKTGSSDAIYFVSGIYRGIAYFTPPLSKDEFLERVTAAETWANMALEPAELRASLDGLETFSLADATRCFYRLYAERIGKARWGDKTGIYLNIMTALQDLLPEARFIHIIRDGRDNALSFQGLWFGPGNDFADLAQFWVGRITAARQQAQSLPHYLEVRYEALVSEPERVLREICNYIALPFDPAMLAYHDAATTRLAEYTRPFGRQGTPTDIDAFRAIYARAATPPDTARIGRWRTEMPLAAQRRFEAVAGPLLRELGYETMF